MPPVPRIGTMFAGYRVEGLLGRGGMGVVYRAEHPRLGAPVALKVMEPELANDDVFRERFVREARAAARIRHANIIPIYDAGEWRGDLYLAMRLIEGEDLRSLLRKDAPLPVARAEAIGMQVASALDAAHRNGVIHRDVKPANILIEPSGEPGSEPAVYLADLGLTKHLGSHVGVTESGELLGTIDYIAPEQISNGDVDGRADLYSLACVLFECLTGAPPYERENQAAVLWAHLHDDIPRASSVNAALPPGVDSALARGMAKSPHDRFSTARELVEALRNPFDDTTTAIRGDGDTAVAPGPAHPSKTTSTAAKTERGITLLVVTAVSALVLGAGAATAIVLLATDRPEGTAAATTRQSASSTAAEHGLGALTPFDEALLQYVPDDLRASCRHADPITTDFDATVSCRPGGAVSSVTYSHARSGLSLFRFFKDGLPRLGLPKDLAAAVTGKCSTGDIPSLNVVAADGLRGRMELAGVVPEKGRLGLVRCWREGGRARIEWLTREVGVYAAATGKEIHGLFEWWRHDAGPEP